MSIATDKKKAIQIIVAQSKRVNPDSPWFRCVTKTLPDFNSPSIKTWLYRLHDHIQTSSHPFPNTMALAELNLAVAEPVESIDVIQGNPPSLRATTPWGVISTTPWKTLSFSPQHTRKLPRSPGCRMELLGVIVACQGLANSSGSTIERSSWRSGVNTYIKLKVKVGLNMQFIKHNIK